MYTLTVTFNSTPLFIVTMVFTVVVSFVAGALWMASGQNNKDAEEDAKKNSAKLIDLDEVLRGENMLEWKKTHSN